MAKDELEWSTAADALVVQDVLDFANEDIAARAWERGAAHVRTYSSLLLFELLHPRADVGDCTASVTTKRLAHVTALQRELRAALDPVAHGHDLVPVLDAINREGPFRYTLRAELPTGPPRGRKYVTRAATFRWEREQGGDDRHKLMRALAEVLVRGARGIRQCDYTKCARFFLAKRERAQRANRSFCSPQCSTRYWNEARSARRSGGSGYFTRQRRKNRARQRGMQTQT